MKLHIISDTHTKHRELDLPGGDVLIHAGDFMSSGYSTDELIDFLNWLEVQPYEHKIYIAGNHDRIFEDNPAIGDLMNVVYPSLTYLQDSEVVIDGVKFYGSPWTPEFMGWAFALPKDERSADERFKLIPEDTDVVISHGPAFGKLDQVDRLGVLGEHLGCPSLSRRIEEINPQLHICGHIHSGRGVMDGYGQITTHINASCLGEDYMLVQEQNYIEWEIKSDEDKRQDTRLDIEKVAQDT